MSWSSLTEFLRPHKTIPRTLWTSDGRWDLNLSRVAILFTGLFIFGLGDALLIQSNVGNTPWSVLAQGVSQRFDFTLGWSTFIISGAVLLAWIPLRERPGFGTIANLVIIAIAIEVGVTWIPIQSNFFAGLVFCFLGIGIIGIATSLYITCGLGPGPRDGLMTGLHKRTGVRVGRIRLGIEAGAVAVGALLGGNVGIGTLFFALLIGQSVAVALGVVGRFSSK